MSSSEARWRSARRCWPSGTRCCGARSATPTPRSSPSGCSSSGTSCASRWSSPTIRSRIRAALVRLRAEVDVIVATGGLGPTEDDRTVDVVAELLATGTHADEPSLEAMKKRFSTHGFEMTPNNLRQVRVPNGAEALPNAAGIAPGFVVRARAAREAFFLPGVPREMEKMFTDEVLPRLARRLAETGRAAAGGAHLAPLRDGRVAHRPPPGRDPERHRGRDAALSDLDPGEPRQGGGARRRPDEARGDARARSTPRCASGSAPASTASTARPSVGAVAKSLRAQEATLAFAESCTGGLGGRAGHVGGRAPAASSAAASSPTPTR